MTGCYRDGFQEARPSSGVLSPTPDFTMKAPHRRKRWMEPCAAASCVGGSAACLTVDGSVPGEVGAHDLATSSRRTWKCWLRRPGRPDDGRARPLRCGHRRTNYK